MTAGVGTELTVVSATLLGDKPYCFETVFDAPGESSGGSPGAFAGDAAGDTAGEPIGGNGPGNATVTFLSPHQIVIGAPVKLEADNSLWMGSVISCRRKGELWRTTLHVEHTLHGLAELLNLAARFE